jgi:plastocyanin
MRTGKRSSIVAVLVLLLVAGCGGSSDDTTTTAAGGAGPSDAVAIDNFSFVPSELTVSVGDAVTWTNEQNVAHTVTADGGEFDSGNLAQGAEFSQTFDTTGTFSYSCAIHPSMTGTVTVEG